MVEKRSDRIKEPVTICAAILFLTGIFWITGCPIKAITGVPCLGCGMTRAWISLFQGNLQGAFYYHPCWMVPAVYVFSFLLFKDHRSKKYIALESSMIFMFAAVYLLRLWMHHPVVCPDLSSGLIGKALDVCIFR